MIVVDSFYVKVTLLMFVAALFIYVAYSVIVIDCVINHYC
jgi:hypothetical protein